MKIKSNYLWKEIKWIDSYKKKSKIDYFKLVIFTLFLEKEISLGNKEWLEEDEADTDKLWSK